jgi:hypothetical protein
LVGKEEHDGEEVTIDGGWLLRDQRWTAKELADDHDSWGKTIARPRGLATQKELQWLAGGEWAAAAYLGDGEKLEKRVEVSFAGSFYKWRRERGGVGGPTHRCRGASDLPVRVDHGVVAVPCPRMLAGGPQSVFQMWREPKMV